MSDADAPARLAAAKEENERLRASLTDKDREIFLLKEKLYAAITAKKAALAEQAAAAAAEGGAEEGGAGGSSTPRNAYGEPVKPRPHISPRTRKLTQNHLTAEQFAGNYGQRLYQYGVTEFHKKSDEKKEQLREDLDMELMKETRPKLIDPPKQADTREEWVSTKTEHGWTRRWQQVPVKKAPEKKVLVGSFQPKVGRPPKKGHVADEDKPFWDRLHQVDE